MLNLNVVVRKQPNPECGTDSALDSFNKSVTWEERKGKKGRDFLLVKYTKEV